MRTNYPALDKFPSGEGWETLQDLAERLGVDERNLDGALRTEVDRGKVEIFSGQMMMGRQVLRQVWYRPALRAYR